MDAQRALLDELMGRNRDGDKPNEEIKDYRDARVCKHYLCGLCPHDLFQNTKMDLGECPKLHLPKQRLNYDADIETRRAKRDLSYEMELEHELVRIISDVEKKIQRAQKRLEEQDGVKAPSLGDLENSKEVLEITAEIQEVLQKAEDAGNEGEVDLSMELMEKVEELKQKKAIAQAKAMLHANKPEQMQLNLENNTDNTKQLSKSDSNAGDNTDDNTKSITSVPEVLHSNPLASPNVNQKLRVCDVCGAFLSIFDSDRRLADHFGGKLHLGYLQVRKKIQEIQQLRDERRKASASSITSKGEERETGSKESTRGRGRSRSRSRPRRNEHSDRYDGHRHRTSHRSDSRHHSSKRDRSHDRGGNHRSRRRHRSRSNSDSRSRSRSRSPHKRRR